MFPVFSYLVCTHMDLFSFKCYVQWEIGGVTFLENRHEGVWFNVIRVLRGLGCPIFRKKHYVTLESPRIPILKVGL